MKNLTVNLDGLQILSTDIHGDDSRRPTITLENVEDEICELRKYISNLITEVRSLNERLSFHQRIPQRSKTIIRHKRKASKRNKRR